MVGSCVSQILFPSVFCGFRRRITSKFSASNASYTIFVDPLQDRMRPWPPGESAHGSDLWCPICSREGPECLSSGSKCRRPCPLQSIVPVSNAKRPVALARPGLQARRGQQGALVFLQTVPELHHSVVQGHRKNVQNTSDQINPPARASASASTPHTANPTHGSSHGDSQSRTTPYAPHRHQPRAYSTAAASCSMQRCAHQAEVVPKPRAHELVADIVVVVVVTVVRWHAMHSLLPAPESPLCGSVVPFAQ